MAIQDVTDRLPIYVWEAPVRLAHWVHVAAMVVLAVSGYYIGDPFLVPPATNPYVMGEMRLAHAVAAIFLGMSFIVRVYWSLRGNPCSRLTALLPIRRQRLHDFGRQVKYYLFLSNRRPDYEGHNPVAGLTYFVMWVLVFLQGFIGLALYSEYYTGGFWWTFFGWAFHWLGQNSILRLVHHSLMWVFIVFFVVHLYLAVLNDLVEHSGIVSSIIVGYKYPRRGSLQCGRRDDTLTDTASPRNGTA